MKTAPNRTVVTGLLRQCEAAADGIGGELEIDVSLNESPDAGADFIKPKIGHAMRAFCGSADDLAKARTLVGQQVQLQLTFLGGPSGGRAIVQSLKAKAANK
jgi:hypothetical protein